MGYIISWLTYNRLIRMLFDDHSEHSIRFAGCEVNQEVNITNQKFIIKIFIPTEDGLSEVWLRADSVRGPPRDVGDSHRALSQHPATCQFDSCSSEL